jgi:hypothetical protein
VHMATSYLLMLAVMTFNVGFFVAVVVGMGIGHFIFQQQSQEAPNAHGDDICHETVYDA